MPKWRRIAAKTLTVAAGLLVLFVLVVPADLQAITAGALLRLPVEAVLGAALLLALPERPRRIAAIAGGVALGLLTVVKAMDMGFDAVLYRPFDLVLDWPMLGPGIDYLDVTVGRAGSIGAVVLVVLLVLGLIALLTFSVLRLTRVVSRHRQVSGRVVAVLAVVWIALAIPGVPVASHNAAAFTVEHARQVQSGLTDHERFAAEAAVDKFRDTPGDQLLTGLRGKDVMLTFVESYGRVALEHPELAPQVSEVLDAGTQTLREAGFSARSAYLTSPMTGAGSWLAHATLLSGLWINNDQRYRNLIASDRLSLPSAFAKASWRSVGVMPGITRAWPEGGYFGYQKIYPASDLGYQGPRFGYATMPDEYTLSAFQRDERASGHAPVMATIPLVSSHAPWTPLPGTVGWDQVGDGSVFHTMPSGEQSADSIFGGDPQRVRANYRESVEYSLNSLISYVKTYGDDNLVLVFVGDHQPAQLVTGENAGKDVPITLVARDSAVLDRIAGWNWDEGLRPGPGAPVWPMNSFRDEFLTAFG